MALNTPKTRDNFLAAVRNALALRANYQCSLASCRIPTSGPSDESPQRHISIGVAAHITAAAPGGARYDECMTPSQRADVTNGIWLCQTHSKLIDADSTAYSVRRLHQIKTDHEKYIRSQIDGSEVAHHSDFVALGHDLVFIGELVSSDVHNWIYRLDHFIIGDLNALIIFGERFESTLPCDLFVLDNAFGEGRQLGAPPVWTRKSDGYEITVNVQPSFPRIDAHKPPLTMAVDENNDFAIVNGSLARIRGLESLPQTIRSCLSTIRGEVFLDRSIGTRIHEY